MPPLNRRLFVYTSIAGTAVAAASAMAQAQQGGTASQSASPPAAGNGPLNLPEPGQRKGEYFEHGGARIFYTQAGQGSPLLLVHGYPLSGALFARVVNGLAQRHTVITPDLRGYGQSHAPGMTDSVDVYAEDMLALMDKLGLRKAAIGGMSMGGPTVFSMLKKAPERFDGLVLIDTNFKKANPAEAGLWRGVAAMAEANGSEDIIPFLLPQMLTGKTRMEQKAQVEYLTAVMKQASKEALVSGAKALAARADATELLGTIAVPTLIVVGQDDPLYAVEIAQMMQQKIKGAQLHVVPDAAHAAIFEKPDDAGSAIAGWAGNTRTGGK